MKLLMTEKKSVATKLAEAMGWRPDKNSYVGKFEGEEIRVVWARGHLVTLQEPEDINEGLGWNDPVALESIPRSFPLKPTPDSPKTSPSNTSKAYLNHIGKYLKECTEFINGGDADREGEAIPWLVLKHLGYTGPVRRAWFAAGMDKKSLQDAMANLKRPEDHKGMFRAAEARGRADWAFMYLTRAYTFYGRRGHFGTNLGVGSCGKERVVSAGRVQTPTLGLIVRREHEIKNFKPVDHFVISGHIQAEGANDLVCSYQPVVTSEVIDRQPPGVHWQPSKRMPKNENDEVLDEPLFVGKAEVDAFEQRLVGAGDNCQVLSYKASKAKTNPPKTMSLTDAQTEISKQLKISPEVAQEIVSDLYQQGYTSYPRTAKAELPANLYQPSELNGMLSAVCELPDFSEQASVVRDIHAGQHPTISKFKPPVFVDKDMEHYGLIPTNQKMTVEAFESLSPTTKGAKYGTRELQEVYKLIVKRFIQALYPPAVYDRQEVSFVVPVEDMLGNPEAIFKTSGKTLVDPGWLNAFGEKPDSEKSFSPMSKGQSCRVTSVSVKAQETSPPKRYTEVNIVKAMENVGRNVTDPDLRKKLKDSGGIGTPATRSAIIANLKERGYVEVKKGSYYPTAKGVDIIDIVAEQWMKVPETTAMWEDFLLKMDVEQNDERAKSMRDAFVNKQIDAIENIIKSLNKKYEGNIGQMQRQPPKKITPNMKKAIDFICKKLDIKCPTGTKTDPVKAKAFLDEHKQVLDDARAARAARAEGPASEKQCGFIDAKWPLLNDEQKAKLGGDEAVTAAKKNGASASKFINKLVDIVPPSQKRADYARSLAEKLPDNEKPDESIFASDKKCGEFIDKMLKKGSGKSSGGKKASSAKAKKKPAAKK